MSETAKCPKCDQQLVNVGKHWICPEHGHILMEKPSVSMRIFLSYGHDANEVLVRRIKNDLEKRGHDVWFDKNDIRPDDNWRRSITDGILKCHRFLSFLSKYSTRDPGVCRDEIAISIGVKEGNIQTILVESETEVQPPVSISHVQWLDMHDWKDGHGKVTIVKDQPVTGDPAWESWYKEKLFEIIHIIESDESLRFAGEIEKLNGYLKPIKSHARIKQLLEKGFFGRKWLFEAVENWRTGTVDGLSAKNEAFGKQSRLFWITGDPGVGKSAFAAQLTHTRPDAVIAAQFVEWDKPDHRDARRVVRSLAFQLATRLPDYRKLLLTLPEIAELDRKDPAELFDYLLANPLRSVIGGGRERQLIVIDALDEAGEAGRNPLVEMLARHAPRLPDWLGLVVTSRPESAVQTPLQGLNPFVLDTRTEANRADLRDYLRQKLAPQLRVRPDADRLLGQILEKSEGVFLYVERFCDDVQQNHLSLDRPDQFPQGLGGIFCQWFERQFPDLEKFRKDVRPALRAILAAREPLPVEILQRLFHWQDEELRDLTRTLGSLFLVTKEADCEVIKPYHKSLTDWLADEAKAGPYYVSVAEGHRILAIHCWSEYERGTDNMSAFCLRYLIYYLRSVHRDTDMRRVLLDKSLKRRRCQAGLGCVLLFNHYTDNEVADRIAQYLEDRGHVCICANDVQTQGKPLHEIFRAQLEAANLYLFLLSPALMGSITGPISMRIAMAEYKAGHGLILPVILRRCYWKQTPLSKCQAYPFDYVDDDDGWSIHEYSPLASGIMERNNGEMLLHELSEKLETWFASAQNRSVFANLFEKGK